jgi:anti-sigma B factor antagonist
MSITVKTNGTQQCITLTGELKIFTESESWQSRQLTLRNAEGVEIDLLGVGDIDKAGIQLLLMTSKSEQDKSSPVRCLNHSQAVVDGLDLFDLVAHFGVPVEEEAEKSAFKHEFGRCNSEAS